MCVCVCVCVCVALLFVGNVWVFVVLAILFHNGTALQQGLDCALAHKEVARVRAHHHLVLILLNVRRAGSAGGGERETNCTVRMHEWR